MRLREVYIMSDSSDIMDIDSENKKGKRRDYINHANLRGLAHKNHVNKNVPERSTGHTVLFNYNIELGGGGEGDEDLQNSVYIITWNNTKPT